jgi:hypothetical protein
MMRVRMMTHSYTIQSNASIDELEQLSLRRAHGPNAGTGHRSVAFGARGIAN